MRVEPNLRHFGVKGMKWGVRKQKDAINSRTRIIKKGTVIQNIAPNENRDQNRHMYAAYTPYDKSSYINMMGNIMYDESYKHEFIVKKDIKIPSDRHLVETFVKITKENPKQVAKDMTEAYNEVHIFSQKSEKYFNKKVSKISEKNTKRGEKLTKEYLTLLASNKTEASRANFFGTLLKEGFDGISDVNDRDSILGTQDPLIIIKPSKVLGKVSCVKLTDKDLQNYWKLSGDEQYMTTQTVLKYVQQ